MRELTAIEVEEVNGGWIANIIGAIAGGVGGAIGAYTAGGSGKAIAIATVSSAIGGAIFPINGYKQFGRNMFVAGVGAHTSVDINQMYNRWSTWC